MKNKYFSRKIFIQGLRVLRLPGLILAISTLALSLLQYIVVVQNLAISNQSQVDNPIMEPSYFIANAFSISANLFLFLGPLILTLSAFSFLRKRYSSDFYHSIPVNRTCLFTSYTLSVIAWVFAIIIADFLLRNTVFMLYDISSIGSDYIHMGIQISTLLSNFTSVLVIISGVLLAMSITGTLFGNLAISAVVIYLPNLVYYSYSNSIVESVGNIIGNNINYSFSSIMSSSIISPMPAIMSPFLWMRSLFPSSINPLYSTLLISLLQALLYLGIALLLFTKRKSEMAGHGNASPFIQGICRVTVTLTFAAFIPILFIPGSISYNSPLLSILIILSLIVFFAYELITTRRISALLKTLPSLLVVAGIVIFGIMGLHITRYNILSFTPDASQVNSIQFVETNTYSGNAFEYSLNKTKDIQITSNRAKEIVCSALKRTVEYTRTRYEQRNHEESYSFMDMAPPVSNDDYYMQIKINTGFSSKKRRIGFTNDETIELLKESTSESDEFKNAMRKMPSVDEINHIYIEDIYGGGNIDIDNVKQRIYNIYSDECENLSIEEFMNLTTNHNIESESTEYRYRINVSYNVAINSESFRDFNLNYKVSPELTPKTLAEIEKYIVPYLTPPDDLSEVELKEWHGERNENDIINHTSILNEILEKGEEEGIQIKISNYNDDDNLYQFIYNDKIKEETVVISKEDFDIISDILRDAIRNLYTGGNAAYRDFFVTLNLFDSEQVPQTESYEQLLFTNEQIAVLDELLEKYGDE